LVTTNRKWFLKLTLSAFSPTSAEDALTAFLLRSAVMKQLDVLVAVRLLVLCDIPNAHLDINIAASMERVWNARMGRGVRTIVQGI